MSIQHSQAILLRRQDLRETSIILTFYTRDFGKIKGIVRGVRGPRAQGHGGGAHEIFALDDIVFYERKSRDIYTVSQCDLRDFFSPIRASLEKLGYATYMIELLDSVTALSDPHPEVFDLTLGSLRLLAGEESGRRMARIFEIKLLSLLGIMPRLGSCANCSDETDPSARFSLRHGGLICKSCFGSDALAAPIMPGTAKFIEHIQSLPFDKVARIGVTDEVGKDLELILRRFLDYYVERKLNSLSFLRHIDAA
jgi:DNA repair protein RecO (recombination protein O)